MSSNVGQLTRRLKTFLQVYYNVLWCNDMKSMKGSGLQDPRSLRIASHPPRAVGVLHEEDSTRTTPRTRPGRQWQSMRGCTNCCGTSTHTGAGHATRTTQRRRLCNSHSLLEVAAGRPKGNEQKHRSAEGEKMWNKGTWKARKWAKNEKYKLQRGEQLGRSEGEERNISTGGRMTDVYSYFLLVHWFNEFLFQNF